MVEDPANAGYSYMRSLLLSILIALATGCASNIMWAKADTPQSLASQDLAECRQLASDEAWRLRWERNWPPGFYDPAFMPPFYAGRRPFWRYFPNSIEREQALVDFCMHSKGYRLTAIRS